MWADFKIYFGIGWEHIIGPGATDHILFIAVLAAAFTLRHAKKLLWLVTAFTVGHSLTLALSVYQLIQVNMGWVEFLIPCTILLAAVHNLLQLQFSAVHHIGRQYGMAVFFGLIHGLGFANSIQFMLAASQSIGWPLFSFNLGLEAGQLVLVALLTTISWLLQSKWPQTRKYWIVSISLLALLIAGWMAISRWPL
jgi:hypothetical protein